MDKSTNLWKTATISLMFVMVVILGFYFIEFDSISQNSGFKETNTYKKQTTENIIPIIQKEEKTTRTKADYSWIPIYFETIDKRTEAAQIPKLKSVSLSEDDLEVRIWSPTGYFLLEGFLLKRNNGQWSAVYLEGVQEKVNRIQYQKNKNEYQKELPEPKSGWDNTWKRLVDGGISTLPDATELNCNESASDGYSIIVEYKVDHTYKTYEYDNPSDIEPKCSEAQQISELFEIVKDEFRFIEYKL